MSIVIPTELLAWAETQAARAGFASASEYVADLVRRDLEQHHDADPDAPLRQAMAEGGEDPATISPERLRRRKAEIEEALLEGLDSGPAREATAEFWEERHRTLEERTARRRGSKDA
jgi:Arc/MetJ-type ribon-helix-helix transcriptional regulator